MNLLFLNTYSRTITLNNESNFNVIATITYLGNKPQCKKMLFTIISNEKVVFQAPDCDISLVEFESVQGGINNIGAKFQPLTQTYNANYSITFKKDQNGTFIAIKE